MNRRTREHASRRALSWARAIGDDSALYARLARHVAASDELLDLIRVAPPEQLEMNLLFGAVQSLLLDGAGHRLADWYPALGGGESGPGLEEAFSEFVANHRQAIATIIATRRVQTNEVGRCAFLVPAYNFVAQQTGLPLAVIEVGTSAGLNLNIDRYGYTYASANASHRLHPEATVQLECDTGAVLPANLGRVPPIGWRTGLDVHPVDLADPEQARWLRALVWPDQVLRHRTLAAAIEVAQAHPPAIVAGSARDVLAGLLAEAPEDCALLVQHSFVLNQVAAADRTWLFELLDAAGETRPIYRVGAEWLASTRITELEVTAHGAERHHRILGRVHHHGRWMALQDAAPFP